jgi:hypothetical protein
MVIHVATRYVDRKMCKLVEEPRHGLQRMLNRAFTIASWRGAH